MKILRQAHVVKPKPASRTKTRSRTISGNPSRESDKNTLTPSDAAKSEGLTKGIRGFYQNITRVKQDKNIYLRGKVTDGSSQYISNQIWANSVT